ncbi:MULTISPECIES: flagellar filament capping protein FliD [Thalassospira]|jgi:flagellar hook-associated protein 2|uniref:Flagellar hook-associated protein 2 n=1 Tax=Thalassospira xiamenensis TaxID=220697 RepID=A0ABR5Y338_9PROT|nr:MULTISPECIES: flagellar filament capping protein FliD [Thalassospira]MAL30156.1 flagellar hook protein FliD [Thalassospira sp.]MBR9778500.1 flagellar filament capping protein FliD [Rhodospirillales bacterium]KZD03760.1 flagellar hook protein FliD [Thalassospira xiamenensis]KZD05879.1 flagellar hook protein FliD [Thalassospira xiamenensis]MBL4842597.1 flagellar filament capping protein FliD [Thalassospira sp.]|tara:strand:+ start:1019 stop:2791 length:1773 start_codon:yes stop_codon:yes gene_type:complete
MSSVNLNNIYVGDNGRIQLSGGSSNIDFVDVVDKMIAARRIPADSLEKRIESNDDKLKALKDLQKLMGTLKDSMANLYGATSFDKSKNIFESKQIYASTDSSTTAGELIGITASNAAATGSYSFEVDQIATKHKLSSDTIGVAAGADATGISGTGQFTITGGTGSSQITVNAGDTLQDIRDKINNLTDSTGVQASVIKVSPTESTLIFTSTSEGEDNRISFSDDTGAVLQNLGVLSDPTTINAANVIDGGNNALIKLDGVTVSRSSNEFSDLVDGLSISLYDAEPGTKIKIDVEQDLNQAKTAIVGFVDAYNAVQSFINEKTFVDPTTGEASEDAILLGNSTVKTIESALQQIAGSFAQGVTDRAGKDDYSVLAEIGIDFIAYGTNQDPLLNNTLKIDETKLNDALLKEPDEVMELFLFRSKSDNSDLTMTGFSGKTNAAEYSFNIDASGGTLNSVTYDITVDGVTTTGKTAMINGNTVTTADGLRLIYSGDGNAASTATLNTSKGIGAQIFFELDSLLKDETGTLSQEVTALETQNTSYQDKIDRIDERLASQRENLMDRFINMETALARMKNIQNSLDELMAAGKDKN